MSQSHSSSLAIANRYAAAAFALGQGEKNAPQLVEEFSTIARAAETDENLRTALANPLVSRQQKADVLNALAAKASALTKQTLATIAQGGRADMLPAIATALRARLTEANGEIEAVVTSARALSPAMQKQLTKSLEQATGKKLQLTLHEDATLIGGVVIQLGSLRLDASMSGALNQIRADLMAHSA